MTLRALHPVGLLLVLALVAIPAGAALRVDSTPIGAIHVMPAFSKLHALPDPASSAGAAPIDLHYNGGAILKAPKVYIVYWGWHNVAPTGDIDPSGEAAYLEHFFAGIGGSGWANIQTQYDSTAQGFITNPTGQLAGVWYDDATLPPPVGSVGTLIAIENVELAAEAAKAANHFGLSTSADASYVIALPHHDDTDIGGGYCAYHSSTVVAGRVISYTDLPYMTDFETPLFSCGQNFVNAGAAGKLDGVSIVAGHEYAESVTDPAPDSGWVASDGENGDKCAWQTSGAGKMQNLHLATGDFAVQGLWSNAAHGCVISYP